MSGHLEGLQTKVRQRFPASIFIHCMAHGLNLVLEKSASNIKKGKIFSSTLSGLAAFFFSKSSKRTHALDLIVKKRLPTVAPTRWSYSGRLVQIVITERLFWIFLKMS